MAITRTSPKAFLGAMIPNVKILSNKIDEIIDAINGLEDTVSTADLTVTDTVDFTDAAITYDRYITRQTATTVLTATQIVGTSAGDLGHAGGATLVAAPGSGYALRVVDVVWKYNYDTAAYTGGGNDLKVQSGGSGTACTAAVTSAALLGAAADSYYSTPGIAATLNENESLVAASTAWTNPGTAAGILTIVVTYDIISL